MENKKLIAVDFDGTLTNGNVKWWKGENPIPNKIVIEWVDKEYMKGNIIIIHTARPWKVAQETISWLIKNEIRFHGVMFGKLSADIYLDDKSKNPEELQNA